jgi:ABC-type multidrug transport system fused ATPase/permease subunit
LKKTIGSVLDVLEARERKIFWLQSAAEIVISVCDILFITVLLIMITRISGGNALKTYWPAGAWNEKPLLLPGFFIFAYCVKNILAWLLLKHQYNFYYRVAGRISSKNLEDYLHADFREYIKTDSSVHTRKISQQPVEFAHYVLRGVQQVITQSVLVVFAILLLVVFNATLFLLLFLFLAPPLVIWFYAVRKTQSHIRHHIKTYSEKSLQYLQEALSGFVENKFYAKKRFFNNRYRKYQQQLNHVLAGRQVLQGSSSRVIEIFALVGLFMLVVLREEFALSISTFTIGAFMGAAYKIIPGVVKIMNSLAQVKAYAFAIDKKKPLNIESVTGIHEFQIETLELRNLSFSFGESVLLDKICFKMERGDIAGIAGFSGRGKTTLVNLLLGFLHPTSGEICINGMNVSGLKSRAWKRISYVKQQAFLINDSTLKNVTLSDEGADENKYAAVLEMSGLAGAAVSFITENGRNISGGQRQRVAFARALYKDFDFLLLDEPFSELDHESEIMLLSQLKKLSKQGKIILLITHNRKALAYCNKILSLDE